MEIFSPNFPLSSSRWVELAANCPKILTVCEGKRHVDFEWSLTSCGVITFSHSHCSDLLTSPEASFCWLTTNQVGRSQAVFLNRLSILQGNGGLSAFEAINILPSCDTNFATRDISFWSIFKCLLHFFWRNRKRFLNGTNAILKFDNLASRCNFFRFLFALQLFLINF